MDSFGIRDIIYVSVIFATGVATFLGTKHNLKDFIRDKYDSLQDKLYDQSLEIERLKGKDENQQQIIDTFQKQVLDHLPALFDILGEKGKPERKRK